MLTSTARPAVSPTPAPTVEAKDAYLALASTVNSEWMALGPAPSPKAPPDERQRYQAAWFALEDEVAAGLSAINWPPAAQAEGDALAAAVAKVRTFLQPSETSGQFLELIEFTAREQTLAAATLRAKLGLTALVAREVM
jgi:hypothetical protein